MKRLSSIVALLLVPGFAAAQSPDAQLAADVDAMVTRVMALDAVAGLSVAVVQGDRAVLTKGYGWADIERKRPVTENTVFYIASTTKAFTALNVLLLAERGTVSLDAPISRYLPGVQWGSGVNADSITVRQLLSHTHGIDNNGPVVFRTAFTGVHTNDLLKSLLRHHPASDAGHAYRYTNLGYNIAGIIIDDVTASRWQDGLEANVLKPLGMNSTTAIISRFDSAQLAMPYARDPAGSRRLHYAKGDGNMQAAGGLVSTAADLARWLEAQINLGLVDGRQVFPRAVMAETHRIQAPFPAQEGAQNLGYALGWNVSLVNGDTVLHHGGGFSTFRTYIAFSPRSRIGVALMTSEGGLGAVVVDFLTDYVLDRGMQAEGWRAKWEGRLTELETRLAKGREAIAADRARRAARPQVLPHAIETYAGTYDNAEGGTLVWTVRDGRLWAQIGLLKSIAEVFDGTTNKLRVELEPGAGEVIQFNIDNGRAVSLNYSGRVYERRD
jgi:CubicO group peptidase (beta-lactamase class C family)